MRRPQGPVFILLPALWLRVSSFPCWSWGPQAAVLMWGKGLVWHFGTEPGPQHIHILVVVMPTEGVS